MDRAIWLVAASVAVSMITFVAVRRGPVPPVREAAVAAPPPSAVARTHFVDGGGYVEIGGVVAWASANPAAPILPGHVLRYEPSGDGHTVKVVLAADPATEEPSA